MKKWFIGLTCVGMLATAAMGAINIGPGTPVSQNFDSIGATATATLPTDWKVDKQTTARLVGTFSAAVTATERVEGALVSTTAGNGIYNLGAPADDSVDRAIGWLSSSTATKSGNLYVEMVNSGASAITSLDINYNVEKYRNGSNAAGFQIQLYYSTDGTTWTSAGAAFLTTFPADADNTGFATAPGATTAVSGTLDLSATPIAASGALYLAWNYSVATGSTTSNAQLLGVDDISISLGGPAVFRVSLDQLDGLQVDQGSTDVITASAANGTGPYTYAWSSTLGASYYTANAAAFTILATAPIGDYSVAVVATDSTSATTSNGISFSVVAPVEKYAINITAPVNGTVTTTPATEAAAGATVTINATAASGYAVGTKTVTAADSSPVTVTGNNFTMPAQAVTVAVTFTEASTSGALIISQYYEGASNNKWIELYNPGASAIDLGAGGYRIGTWANANREAWKTNAVPTGSSALSNSIPAGGTYLIKNSAAALPAYAVADITSGAMTFTGDDTVALYTGATFAFANVVDAFGASAAFSNATDKSYVRASAVTAGVNTDFNAADWVEFSLANVESASAAVNEYLGYHSTGAAVLGVSFDKTSGFTVEVGSSATITATAANGTAPYTYAWTTSMGVGDYSASGAAFTILATAPVGSFSAQVVATDNASAKVTNSINFSVVAPATKYAITITAPVNGTVTTTPATEAAAGVTVTVNATPAGGYAVGSIVVNGGAVTVTGNAFTMPAAPATVTVTFMEYTAPDSLITFETATLPAAYAANTALLEDGKIWSTIRVVRGNTAGSDRMIGTNSARLYPVTGTNAVLQQTQAYAEPITQLSFWVGSYGGDNMTNVVLTAEVSPDGSAWTPVLALSNATEITSNLTEHVVSTIPANSVYVRFVATAAAASNKRFNLDNIGVDFGVATFSVSVNKSNGFTVNQGSSDSITATAANGTPAYSYSWGTTLPTGFSSAGAVFSILATAPTGTYSATVTATDDTAATAQKTVTFSVVGLPPGQPAVLIAGNPFGTVGEEMVLNITVTNEIATDWFIDLKDPDALDNYSYNFDAPPAFTLTPTKVGTYVLSVTAVTGSGNYSNTVNLMVVAAAMNPPIAPITMVVGGGGDFQFELPDENVYRLVRVEGTTPAAFASNVWTTLVENTDYTISGTTLRILTTVPASRMVRLVLGSPQ